MLNQRALAVWCGALLALGVSCRRETVSPVQRAVSACTADADCVVSTRGCCPGCCPSRPYAINQQEADAQHHQCQLIECAEPNCRGIECAVVPGADEFRAVCRAGACAVEPKALGTVVPPGAGPRLAAAPRSVVSDADVEEPECFRADECVVSDFACCPRCCPRAVYAAHRTHVEAMRAQCAVIECSAARHCEAAKCAPAGRVADFSADCVNHRCVAVRRALKK